MTKTKTIFACSKCGAQFPKWAGRCQECGSWGTLQEETVGETISSRPVVGRAQAVINLGEVKNKDLQRLLVNLPEFDRVLGGGLVRGSLILLGGDPGIGKSTIALQLAGRVPGSVYVSGEESAEQVGQRLQRINSKAQVDFIAETNLGNILATLEKTRPPLAIIDSIQTVYLDEVAGEAGNISQVRTGAVKLLELAKKSGMTIVIIGHVTKDGVVAGPKTLEHLVDTVLYLEGDKYQQYRLLRAVKNRFGQTGEVGVWEMTASGLKEVISPAEIFLGQIQNNPGTVITPVVEGSRIFLVEVQALVNKTSFGYPRRVTSGFSGQRLEVILAVLAKKLKLPLGSYDVYVNIAGGLNLKEPSLDLAIATAVLSAFYDQPFKKSSLIFGEIGLAGELRAVIKTKERVKEAFRLGFKNIYLPKFETKVVNDKLNLKQLTDLNEVVKLFK